MTTSSDGDRLEEIKRYWHDGPRLSKGESAWLIEEVERLRPLCDEVSRLLCAVAQLREACEIAREALWIRGPGDVVYSSAIGADSMLRHALASTASLLGKDGEQ